MESTNIAIPQTRTESAVESALNIASGFVVSWLVWVFIVAPLFGFPLAVDTSLAITCIFTITSFIRSYVWRRIFNWRSTCQDEPRA